MKVFLKKYYNQQNDSKKKPKIKNDKKVMDIFDKRLAAYEQPFKLITMVPEQSSQFYKITNVKQAKMS